MLYLATLSVNIFKHKKDEVENNLILKPYTIKMNGLIEDKLMQ